MKPKPIMPGKNDFTIAYKAIGFAPGLSGDIKTVGIVILSHFNAKTGQCDPGTERLMAKAQVSRRTVINATNELDKRGLIAKIQHGGNGFRSSYQPNWTRLREIVLVLESEESEPEIVQNLAHTQCKNLHIDSANSCTLTQLRNSPKKLMSTDGACGGVPGQDRQEPSVPVIADKVKGLLSSSLRRPAAIKQRPLSVVDAQEAARLEIDGQIEKLGETMRAFILGKLTPEIQNEAIIAEQKTQGAGLRLVVDRVSRIATPAGRH